MNVVTLCPTYGRRKLSGEAALTDAGDGWAGLCACEPAAHVPSFAPLAVCSPTLCAAAAVEHVLRAAA